MGGDKLPRRGHHLRAMLCTDVDVEVREQVVLIRALDTRPREVVGVGGEPGLSPRFGYHLALREVGVHDRVDLGSGERVLEGEFAVADVQRVKERVGINEYIG